jgi:hypothetical protein
MTNEATEVRNEFVRRYLDRLNVPALSSSIRLANARTAAKAVLTPGNYDCRVDGTSVEPEWRGVEGLIAGSPTQTPRTSVRRARSGRVAFE